MALQSDYSIPELPPAGVDFQSPDLLRSLVAAHRYLAELKGCAASIPNQAILINTLALQEAKASSEVESYVTRTSCSRPICTLPNGFRRRPRKSRVTARR